MLERQVTIKELRTTRVNGSVSISPLTALETVPKCASTAINTFLLLKYPVRFTPLL